MLKLKPIVASMMLLGLAAPAFADDPSAATQTQLDSMKAELAKMEAVVNQNGTGGFYQANDWTNRITISGLANVDAYDANRAPNFVTGATTPGGNTSNLALNNANVLVDALVNDWTKVHIGLLFDANTSTNFTPIANSSRPTLDEGYVTIANFAEFPFFFRAGREYVPFGVYDRYPIVMNPTQLLSMTQATAAQVGFVVPMGFYGSLYGFRGLPTSNSIGASGNTRLRVNNWGADLGYAYADSTYSAKLDAGYINNFDDSVYTGSSGFGSGFVNRVGGLALSADGSAWNFDGNIRYVTALQNFSNANVTTGNLTFPVALGTTASGAKPYALGAELGYSFPVVAHNTRFDIGYQATYNAAASFTTAGITAPSGGAVGAFGLPKNRYYVGYDVNISKWTDIGAEIYNDRDYGTSQGGTGKNATVGVLQLGVKFA